MSDSTKHTPGPWLVNPALAQVDAPIDGAPVCQLLWPTELRSEKETSANARLIAAAPDLRDMLVMALPYVESAVDDEAYKPGRVKALAAKMRAAIAKAEGRA